jgi:hypothetical protein
MKPIWASHHLRFADPAGNNTSMTNHSPGAAAASLQLSEPMHHQRQHLFSPKNRTGSNQRSRYPPLPPPPARSSSDRSSQPLQLDQQLLQQQLQQQQFEFAQRQQLSRLDVSSRGVAADRNLSFSLYDNNAQRSMEDSALSMGFRFPEMRLRDVQPPLPSIGGDMDLNSYLDRGQAMVERSLRHQGFSFPMPLQQSLSMSTEPATTNFAPTDDRTLYRQRTLDQQSAEATNINYHLHAALSAVEVPLPNMFVSVPPSTMSATSPQQREFTAGNVAHFSASPASTVFPAVMACPSDGALMSEHQSFLRLQIEFFRATDEDINAPVRGRNRPVQHNQIGIRCRHCAHVPANQRRNGSSYFPASTLGLCVDLPCCI